MVASLVGSLKTGSFPVDDFWAFRGLKCDWPGGKVLS